MQSEAAFDWPDALPYVEVYMATCRSIRDRQHFRQILETVVVRLNAKNTMQVVLDAEAGSNEAALDMVIR